MTRRNIYFVWGLMAVIGIFDAIGLHMTDMSVKPQAIGASVFHVVLMILLALFYSHWRKDARIASLAHSIAVFLTFTSVTIIMSYITVALRQPLIDDTLVTADRALGLDWVAAYTWVKTHPAVHTILFLAYVSLIPQMVLLILILNFFAMTARNWELMWLFMGACIGCLLFSATVPAAGAFGHFHVEEAQGYVKAFMKVYNNDLRIIAEEPVEGIIQFPSLHVALAIIYTYAARGIRFVYPLFIVLNILLFISSQSIGGHHFADLWAGALLALLLIMAARKIARRRDAT